MATAEAQRTGAEKGKSRALGKKAKAKDLTKAKMEERWRRIEAHNNMMATHHREGDRLQASWRRTEQPMWTLHGRSCGKHSAAR